MINRLVPAFSCPCSYCTDTTKRQINTLISSWKHEPFDLEAWWLECDENKVLDFTIFQVENMIDLYKVQIP